jgi:hypothetical protein
MGYAVACILDLHTEHTALQILLHQAQDITLRSCWHLLPHEDVLLVGYTKILQKLSQIQTLLLGVSTREAYKGFYKVRSRNRSKESSVAEIAHRRGRWLQRICYRSADWCMII